MGSSCRAYGGDSQRGVSLVETMIAALIIVVGMVSVLSLFTAVVAQNKMQGETASQATTFCQDKLEQLRALSLTDSSTDTTVSPPAPTGGTGLCGAQAPNASCGSIDPGNPLNSYVDYLDAHGSHVAGAAQATYIRQWQITADSTGRMKTIAVLTTSNVVSGAATPSALLSTLKGTF